MTKTCIIITGPTAVGKTSLAIEVASHFSTKIISADSRQCYKELSIGVAKPSPEELEAVHHYFINTHTIEDDLNAADYEKYALNASGQVFSENDFVIMTGGTGLYIKAFCEGLDAIPETDLAIRKEITKNYEKHGLAFLQEEIKKEDPVFYETGEIQNPQRMIRALEVKLSTGNSITTYQSNQKKKRDFNIIKIGLELSRESLYERINERVDKMIAKGLVEEVNELTPYKDLNALQTVGYTEIFDHFAKRSSLPRAIELIKQNTRHYAKRQMTWFKKDKEIQWCPPVKDDVMKIIQKELDKACA